MSAITLDESIVKKLPTLHESTEIRDSNGKVLGVFTPLEDSYYNQLIPQHILDKFDPEEMERRRQSTHPGYSLKEVWEHIHAQGESGMKFNVVWTEDAEEELARIWFRSNRQQRISEASNTIDKELKIDAHTKGTQKDVDRVFTIRPLTVLYHVSLEDRLVRVLSVAEETN